MTDPSELVARLRSWADHDDTAWRTETYGARMAREAADMIEQLQAENDHLADVCDMLSTEVLAPWATVRGLREWEQIGRDLAAAAEPELIHEWEDTTSCSMCNAAALLPDDVVHAPSCPWRRARELADRP